MSPDYEQPLMARISIIFAENGLRYYNRFRFIVYCIVLARWELVTQQNMVTASGA